MHGMQWKKVREMFKSAFPSLKTLDLRSTPTQCHFIADFQEFWPDATILHDCQVCFCCCFKVGFTLEIKKN